MKQMTLPIRRGRKRRTIVDDKKGIVYANVKLRRTGEVTALTIPPAFIRMTGLKVGDTLSFVGVGPLNFMIFSKPTAVPVSFENLNPEEIDKISLALAGET